MAKRVSHTHFLGPAIVAAVGVVDVSVGASGIPRDHATTEMF